MLAGRFAHADHVQRCALNTCRELPTNSRPHLAVDPRSEGCGQPLWAVDDRDAIRPLSCSEFCDRESRTRVAISGPPSGRSLAPAVSPARGPEHLGAVYPPQAQRAADHLRTTNRPAARGASQPIHLILLRDYETALIEVIKKKQAHVPVTKGTDRPSTPKNVVNLMDALRRSLADKGEKPAKQKRPVSSQGRDD